MPVHTGQTYQTSAAVPARLRRMSRQASRVAATIGVSTAMILTGGVPASAAPVDRFTIGRAVWNGDVAHVVFRQVGLKPRSANRVAVRATGAVVAVCLRAGVPILTTRSSGTVGTVVRQVANRRGAVTVTRRLRLEVATPRIEGLNCVLEVRRTVRVTLHDLHTGAVRTIHGRA
ncbi:hypothetical protein [Pilimelia columellifera]|uniref:Uncharacterized protein n=1 Tax=Pilimelia columellifera subsp. columellifera TaxID=706583 RepID=A0ABN3N893_9ACTN